MRLLLISNSTNAGESYPDPRKARVFKKGTIPVDLDTEDDFSFLIK